METADQVRHQIEQSGIIAAIRCRAPLDRMLEVGDALHATPITAVMISLGSRQPWEIVAELRQRYGASMVIGAGLLTTPAQTQAAADAGAQFVMTSSYVSEIDTACRQREVRYIPGVRTVEEARCVHARGMRVMGYFPAHFLDRAQIVQITQVHPAACMVAMGGVDARNAGNYARAGAAAVVVRGVLGGAAQWRMHAAIVEMRRLRALWMAAQLEK